MEVLLIIPGFVVYCIGVNIFVNRTTGTTFRQRLRQDASESYKARDAQPR